jgi:hypothetical protein
MNRHNAAASETDTFAGMMNSVDQELPMRERRAALYLDSVHEQDRAWLLAALPGPQSERLQELLAEMQAAGLHGQVPPDFCLPPIDLPDRVDEFSDSGLHSKREPRKTENNTDHATLLRELDETRLAALFGILQDEPVMLSALLLRICSGPGGFTKQSWPWQEKLLSSLPHEKKHQLAEMLHNVSDTPEVLGQALMARLCAAAALGLSGSRDVDDNRHGNGGIRNDVAGNRETGRRTHRFYAALAALLDHVSRCWRQTGAWRRKKHTRWLP